MGPPSAMPLGTPGKCIAPEQYVAADEIFKVSTRHPCKVMLSNSHEDQCM